MSSVINHEGARRQLTPVHGNMCIQDRNHIGRLTKLRRLRQALQ